MMTGHSQRCNGLLISAAPVPAALGTFYLQSWVLRTQVHGILYPQPGTQVHGILYPSTWGLYTPGTVAYRAKYWGWNYLTSSVEKFYKFRFFSKIFYFLTTSLTKCCKYKSCFFRRHSITSTKTTPCNNYLQEWHHHQDKIIIMELFQA